MRYDILYAVTREYGGIASGQSITQRARNRSRNDNRILAKIRVPVRRRYHKIAHSLSDTIFGTNLRIFWWWTNLFAETGTLMTTGWKLVVSSRVIFWSRANNTSPYIEQESRNQ
jgi:hypothetical protein